MKANLYAKLAEVSDKRRAMEKQLLEDETLTNIKRANLKDQIKYLEGKEDGITFGIQEASKVMEVFNGKVVQT